MPSLDGMFSDILGPRAKHLQPQLQASLIPLKLKEKLELSMVLISGYLHDGGTLSLQRFANYITTVAKVMKLYLTDYCIHLVVLCTELLFFVV